jgi:basic amino acid/polyamine antiporter, APA family
MTDSRLHRGLGTADAVIVGLAAMIGTGVFVVWQPAVDAAGGAVALALVLAALVAWLNATSTAGLAALHPRAGGAYHYATLRLGPTWAALAGFAFVVGKTASAATAALAVGTYLWPDQAALVAVAAIVALAAVNVAGVQRTAAMSWALVAAVVFVLLMASVAGVSRTDGLEPVLAFSEASPLGVLTGAAVLFYAFAGYARITVLGEEVRDPRHTIPRAVAVALGITFVLYAVVGAAVLATLGMSGAADASLPVREMAAGTGVPGLVTAVGIGAALAALGALLSLLAGIGRTAFAMADDGVLPRYLAAVHPRSRVPHRAELAAALVAIAAVLTGDLVTTLSVSAFTVLVYYGIAHLAATRLTPDERRHGPWLPWLGIVACLALAFSLPWRSVVIGAAALVVTTGVWWFTARRRGGTPTAS